MAMLSDQQRRAVLLWCGVKLSKDGKTIFNYNPGVFQAGLNFLLAFPFLPTFVNRAHLMQAACLLGLMHLYIWVLSDGTEEGFGVLDTQIQWCYNTMARLSTFVLGLFVSLLLSKTYYANRSVFGTVFGSSMGLAVKTVAWVRVPRKHAGDDAAEGAAKRARELIIRWINAAFRLMWLEVVPGVSKQEMNTTLVSQRLLTQEEWDHIEGLSSRCTHIYQWTANVLADLFDRGYIASAPQLVDMHKEVDQMRGANVWGLPSLPIAYTQIITHMVKMHMAVMALNNGALVAQQMRDAEADTYPAVIAMVLTHFDLVFHNYLFQGLLDLHGALYNPNAGIYLGHLPAINFMDFVRDVTESVHSKSYAPPHKLDLVDLV